jgi:hypothetical protein
VPFHHPGRGRREATGAQGENMSTEERDALEACAASLFELVGQSKPNRWGYDVAYLALVDEARNRARARLAALDKARGIKTRVIISPTEELHGEEAE